MKISGLLTQPKESEKKENFEPISLKSQDVMNKEKQKFRYDKLLVSTFTLDLKLLWSYLNQCWTVL